MTLCEECDNVHPDTRKRAPTGWLCVRFRRMEGMGFVAPKVWTEQEPFMRCSGINGGACPLFERARHGQKDMGV